MRIKRNTGFNPQRNMTTVFGMRVNGFMYDEELAGPDGMHFHVWVPPETTMAQLQETLRLLQKERDVVSMSYDLIEQGKGRE
jgi:hypothetical protein